MPPTAALPAPVTIVLGPEELLAERAVAEIVAAVKAADAGVDVRELDVAEVEAGAFAELVSPSLFGERRVLVVRGIDRSGAADDDSGSSDGVVGELTAYVKDPADDVHVVLVHKGVAKGRGLVNAAKKAGAAEVSCAAVKRMGDRQAFVTAEIRSHGRTLTQSGAELLLEAVGGDLRSLAAACRQLADDTDAGGAIDIDDVRRYYSGRAESTGFQVSDLVLEGRTSEALRRLRQALDVGVDPVPLVSALAGGLRSLALVASAPRGLRPAELASHLGMPDWKIRTVRGQIAGWKPEGVAEAIRAVADADAEVKGAGSDPAYAVERCVLRIAAARER
jgi:DNA polymerase-3 subunit delta